MPPFAGAAEWLMALREVVVPLVEAFAPDVLVTQSGADSHHLDPLAHVETTIDVFPAMWADLHDLAHRACDGRWVALGGGGYELFSVVPRAWALVLAEMLESRPEGPLPEAWRAEAAAAGGHALPLRWLEDPGPEPAPERAERARAEAEAAVAEARGALLPRLGAQAVTGRESATRSASNEERTRGRPRRARAPARAERGQRGVLGRRVEPGHRQVGRRGAQVLADRDQLAARPARSAKTPATSGSRSPRPTMMPLLVRRPAAAARSSSSSVRS